MSAATNREARINRLLKLDEFKELREVATECKTIQNEIDKQTKIINSLYDKRDKLIEDRVCSIEEYKKIRAKHQWERPARRRTIEMFDSDSSGGKKIKKGKKSVKTPKKKPTKYLR